MDNSEIPIVSGATAPASPGVKPKHSERMWFIVAGIIIGNLLIAGATATFLLKEPPTKTTPSITTKPGVKVLPATTSEVTPAKEPVTNKMYVSDPLKLSFQYPSDWRIVASPDNSSITINSVPFDVKLANGSLSKASIKLEINETYKPSGLVSDSSLVRKASQKLVYNAPTAVQRKDTYLTYIQSVDDPSGSGVRAFFISGGNQYSDGQRVSSKDYKKVNPFITVSVNACGDSCDGATPTDVLYDDLSNKLENLTVQKIIQSMRFN